MDLVIVILGEVSQVQEIQISYKWNIKKIGTNDLV